MSQMTLQQAFDLAQQQRQAGRLSDARTTCREILTYRPDHPEVLHLLGMITFQAGEMEEAERLLKQAISLSPRQPAFHGNLGVILSKSGKTEEAITEFRAALELRPEMVSAHNNLGNALRDQGKQQEAIAAYRAALALNPSMPETLYNLGNALRDLNQLEDAVAAYEQALSIRPEYPDAQTNLGTVLQTQGKFLQAIAAFDRTIRLSPTEAKAFYNKGVVLQTLGRYEDAAEVYRQAVALRPDYVEAYNNLGSVLKQMEKVDDAIACFECAVAIRPDHAKAVENLAGALMTKGEHEKSLAVCRRVVELRPNDPDSRHNLGNILRGAGYPEEAIVEFKKALELRPHYTDAQFSLANTFYSMRRFEESIEAYNLVIAAQPGAMKARANLAAAYWNSGRLGDALDAYEAALAIQPDHWSIHSNCIYIMHFDPRFNSAQILQAHRQWDRRHGLPLAGEIKPHLNDRNPDRRLRIGYISPDFRNHCQSLFTSALFPHHDHEQFEIVCYSSVAKPDEITQRLNHQSDLWRETHGIEDASLAQMIRDDKIDILMDLTMHMASARPMVMARKPAPVQIAWLAYPSTTGLSAIDYRLTDPYLDPPGTSDENYSETSIRMADTFWCYDPAGMGKIDGISPNPLPALTNGYVTFGCLNHCVKVSDRTLDLWRQVLESVPDSRLVILAPHGRHRAHILDQLGMRESRIEFLDFAPRERYLQYYHRIDLGLDAIPYNGHTTSLDSMWMGVPVVTVLGSTVVGRAGWSQLCNLNLRELAAQREADFAPIAAGLARDLPRLQELRSTLRGRMEKSPLMDGKRFARNMEAVFRDVWRRWCRSK
jgi:protein O-GlcNAc transferase